MGRQAGGRGRLVHGFELEISFSVDRINDYEII